MIHNIINNKGGIGKTTISAYIAEFLLNKGKKVICIDTDPENHSFARYSELDVISIQLKNSQTNNIDKSAFDLMIEIILDNKGKEIVIDNGASSFNPIINYLVENEILQLFKEENIENIFIGIVAGAGNTIDSINGLNTLLKNFDTRFLVFNNQLMGETKYNGKSLEEIQTIKKYTEKILGIINISKQDEYVRYDIEEFTKYRMLFSDLTQNINFKMMQKRRLFAYRDSIFNQIGHYLK
ncbi:MAG: AAA family ATPase [Arcobacteraceae bacterium]